MIKLTKKKKIIILFGVILLIVFLVFAWFKLFYISNDWQIQISDHSKDCFSNVVNIYSNKDYIVVSATRKIIAKGKSNYSKSIDYLENELKTYPVDKKSWINYEIKSKNNPPISVDQNNSPELQNLFKAINAKNILWCD